MRRIIYIGDRSCMGCRRYRETVIDPLAAAHPGRVEVHIGWDAKINEVNGHCPITRVPTIVVERDGVEEFRFSGFLNYDQLEEIVECDGPAPTFGEAAL